MALEISRESLRDIILIKNNNGYDTSEIKIVALDTGLGHVEQLPLHIKRDGLVYGLTKVDQNKNIIFYEERK